MLGGEFIIINDVLWHVCVDIIIVRVVLVIDST